MQRRSLIRFLVVIGLLLATPVEVVAAVESDAKPILLLLLGPPGSGRDVLAVKVSSTFSLPYISCADLVLDYSDDEGEIGKKMRQFLHSGDMIPDAMILELISERVKKQDCVRGFLLDGFPKTREQAVALKNHFEKAFRILPTHIRASCEWLINFHEGRLVCTTCGRVYHTDRSPPKNAEYCDFCETELTQRDDDSPETLRKKSENYSSTMLPLLNFYTQEKQLVEIDGNRPLDEMMHDIKSLLTAKQVTPLTK
jgi:adenylate kinase